MPIHVKVVTAEQYVKWAGDKQAELKAAADDPAKVWQLTDLAARGEKVYAANCAACHLADGKGNPAMGAPNLTDKVWLHGWGEETIVAMVNGGKNNMMPAHASRLTPEQVRVLAAYVWRLSNASTKVAGTP